LVRRRLVIRSEETAMKILEFERFKRVESIVLQSPTDQVLQAIGNCHCLRRLRLGANNVSDVGIGYMTSGCASLQELYLNLSLVTDGGLRMISEKCRDLEVLQFHLGDRITDCGLQSLSKGCQKLKHLIMLGGNLISDKGIQELARGCTRISELELDGFMRLRMSSSDITRLFPSLEDGQLLRGRNPFFDFVRESGCYPFERWISKTETIKYHDVLPSLPM